MSQETDELPSPKQLEKVGSSWPIRFGIFLLILLVGWFYCWTALPDVRGPKVEKVGIQYYNLLCRGLMKGHLYLDQPVDPYLLTAKDPWDPVARAGRGPHDASYFKHHYYMYFGITPEILLFWPFRIVTGEFITESTASVVFSFLGFVISVWLIAEVKKQYFAKASGWVMLLLVLPLGLATMVPSLLRRPSIWEVPITCAYMCAMASLLCLVKAMHSRRRAAWLAGSSLALGLAVGARPVYLFSCAILVLPLWYWVSEYGGYRDAWRDRQWWRLLCAAIVPVALCGVGLAAYNYARFGSLTEFGQRYQLAGDNVSKLKLFSWQNPPYGFRLYMLEPASLIAYFPYFSVINPPPAPPSNIGIEDPYGVLPNLPFVFMSLALLGTARDIEGRWRNLRASVLCVLGLAVLTGITVMSFGGITNRYMVDFVPALILLAAAGTLYWFSSPWFRGVRRLVLILVTVALVVYSVAFDVCVSIGHNNLMRVEQPDEYGRLAYAGNQLSNAWDHLTGTQYGPLELKVIFPEGKAGQTEVMLATGTSFWSDYIYISYLSDTTALFGFTHTSHAAIAGNPFQIKRGQVQTIRIDMGSLYPPASHPYFDRFKPAQLHLLQHLVKVTVDGESTLEALAEFYDASSRTPSIGRSDGRVVFKDSFSGKIVSHRRLPDALPTPPPEQYGPVKLFLKFPAFSGDRSEPLVCSGRTGEGDLIFVHYINDHQIIIGHDYWGGGAAVSSPINVDYNADHIVEVDYAGLYPLPGEAGWAGLTSGKRAIVRLDGKTVLDDQRGAHPSAAFDVRFGDNAIGASSSIPSFTGVLRRTERLPHTLTDR